jgi:hypothetical protein
VCIKLLNYKIIYICARALEYQNMYISYCMKNLNVQQIYLYNINIHLGLSSGRFQVCFDNIHTLFVTH